jgi:hypothetical protein
MMSSGRPARKPPALTASSIVGPSAGQDVGHRVILGQPQRMPHRHDVEAAADPQVLRHAAQVHRHHQDIRD